MARKAIVSASFIAAMDQQKQEQQAQNEFMKMMYEQYIIEAQAAGFTIEESREYAIRMVNE